MSSLGRRHGTEGDIGLPSARLKEEAHPHPGASAGKSLRSQRQPVEETAGSQHPERTPVSSPLPSWLQSPRGLLAAGGLLLTLLVLVPEVISTARDAAAGPMKLERPDAARAPEAAPLDPLAEPDQDWLTEEAPVALDPSSTVDAGEALDCLVQPFKIVEVGSQVLGLIQTIHVERGDPVTKGQVVVELESGVESAAVQVARMRASLQGAVRASEESLALSASRRKRGKKLFDNEALSVDTREELDTQARIAELELLQAQEGKRLASLELRQARALLARRTLRSPLTGVVTERLMEAGEVVDEETILKVASIDPLRVDVLLPASRYGSVAKGMRATIEPEYPADASVVATVAVVDPVIDAASGTFSVRLDLPNPEGRIPGGLHCTVKFLDE